MLDLFPPPLVALAAGLAAGVVHVLAGPDHLAAVAPLSVTEGRRSWGVGLRWGFGHAAGVLVVGAVLLALRQVAGVSALFGWSEKAVGIALVGIGAWGLWRSAARWVHVHPHAHEPGGPLHAHVHAHARAAGPEPAHEHDHARGHRHGHAPFWIGTLHGVAGSAHVLGILPALALPSRALAALYLGGFGAGTVGAMVAFSFGIGFAADRLRGRAHDGERALRLALGSASVVAVVVGAVWFVRA